MTETTPNNLPLKKTHPMTGAEAPTDENSLPPPLSPSKAPVLPVTWKVVSMRRPWVAQSSWCE